MSYNPWPIGRIPIEFQRPELQTIKDLGYKFNDPREIISIFEEKVAAFAGSKYAVSVDCCSHGIFLLLIYLNAAGTIKIPKNTYLSIPMQITFANCKYKFEDIKWQGIYQLKPYPIWDSAMRWKKNMYSEGYHVCSFQIKKRIPIGRGGMILTNDYDAYKWLKKSTYDGRDLKIKYDQDVITQFGWHYYMTPEDAARGIILMDSIKHNEQDLGGHNNYPDLSKQIKINE